MNDLSRRPPDDPAPCRLCGLPSWLEDPSGAVHDCCRYWADEITAGKPCPSCQASRAAGRRAR